MAYRLSKLLSLKGFCNYLGLTTRNDVTRKPDVDVRCDLLLVHFERGPRLIYIRVIRFAYVRCGLFFAPFGWHVLAMMVHVKFSLASPFEREKQGYFCTHLDV